MESGGHVELMAVVGRREFDLGGGELDAAFSGEALCFAGDGLPSLLKTDFLALGKRDRLAKAATLLLPFDDALAGDESQADRLFLFFCFRPKEIGDGDPKRPCDRRPDPKE